MRQPRVVIVDDHAPFRVSARKLLELDGLRVVGEAGDAASSIAVVLATQPDLVLLDVHLPDGSGFDVAERVAQVAPGTSVVLISSRGSSQFGTRVEQSGAIAFVPKDALSGTALKLLLERA